MNIRNVLYRSSLLVLLTGLGLHFLTSGSLLIALLFFLLSIFLAARHFVGFINLPIELALVALPFLAVSIIASPPADSIRFFSFSVWLLAGFPASVLYLLLSFFVKPKVTNLRCDCGGTYHVRLQAVGGSYDYQCSKCLKTRWVSSYDQCVYCGSKRISVKTHTSTGTPKVFCFMCGHREGPKK